MKNLQRIDSFIYYNSFIQHFDELGKEARLFVDSRDVITMLKGLNMFISPGKNLNFRLYRSASTLIYSLIYGDWLGKVHLMVPHQEELHYNLTKTLFFSRTQESDIREFWYKVVEKVIGLTEQDFDDKRSTQHYFDKLAPKAEELYKVNYLLIETNWRRRLYHLTSKGILAFDLNEENLVELVKSDFFKKIHAAFQSERRGHNNTRNNLTDAIVLCILKSRLDQFKDHKLNYLPVMYDTGLFRRVLRKAGAEEEFKIKFGETYFSILVDDDYLVYLALYRSKEDIKPLLKNTELSNYSTYKVLSDLIAKKKLVNQFVKEYSVTIEKFVRSQFLKICWVKNEIKVNAMVGKLINAKKQWLKSDEGKKIANNEASEVIDQLSDRVERFAIFKDVYEKISSAHTAILKLLTTNLSRYQFKEPEFDGINEFALIRFSIKEEYCGELNAFTKELLLQDESSYTNIIAEIVDNLSSILQAKQTANTTVFVLVLWILDAHKLIIRVYEQLGGNYAHFSDGFLHASAIAKISSDHERLGQVLKILQKINTTKGWEFKQNYQTAIAASYVYFWLWYKRSDSHFFNILKEPRPSPVSEIDSLYEKAIFYADIAIEYLKDKVFQKNEDSYLTSKYYYMINNKVFYITMGGNDNTFREIEDEAGILEGLRRQHPEFWQYRFYDTLAIYHLRKAVMAKQRRDRKNFKSHHAEAIARIDDALNWVISANDQQDYIELKKKIIRITFDS